MAAKRAPTLYVNQLSLDLDQGGAGAVGDSTAKRGDRRLQGASLDSADVPVQPLAAVSRRPAAFTYVDETLAPGGGSDSGDRTLTGRVQSLTLGGGELRSRAAQHQYHQQQQVAPTTTTPTTTTPRKRLLPTLPTINLHTTTTVRLRSASVAAAMTTAATAATMFRNDADIIAETPPMVPPDSLMR